MVATAAYRNLYTRQFCENHIVVIIIIVIIRIKVIIPITIVGTFSPAAGRSRSARWQARRALQHPWAIPALGALWASTWAGPSVSSSSSSSSS